MLNAGIVGLPNVGKSTLFNALTKTRKAESANYPFCTIDPNVGVVQVPDNRLQPLKILAKTNKVIPAAIEMLDIAGLVEGASKGEGLGNQFLANIREVDAIVHVVRCFEDDEIIHNMGSVDPVRDIEIINTELMLSDLQSAENQLQKLIKRAKSQEKEAVVNRALMEKVVDHLNKGKPIVTMELDKDDRERVRQFGMLTSKPVLYACNVAEKDLANLGSNSLIETVREYALQESNAGICILSAGVEFELIDFSVEEAQEYLLELGLEDSGVSDLIRSVYSLLGLASYFTAGEQEVRAWTFKRGMSAPECAGVIHTDFQKGFIKADVVSYQDLIDEGSIVSAREAGKYRLEGKDYLFKDGDVALFKFNR